MVYVVTHPVAFVELEWEYWTKINSVDHNYIIVIFQYILPSAKYY